MRRFGGKVIFEREHDGKCEMCGEVEELRPYGPNGENVCFDCGMKDEPAALRQFAKRLRSLQGVDEDGPDRNIQ